METRFRKLKAERDTLLEVSIPRCLWNYPIQNSTFVLHIFCDASKKAYGCVHYLVKISQKSSQSETGLIFSKVKLAPRKHLPVNQLEEKPTRPFTKSALVKKTNSDLGSERSIPQLE